jgi:uncharacterized protein (TIGR02246 family)
MSRSRIIVPIVCLFLLPVQAGAEMTADEKAVHAAVDRWFVALNAMFAGDPEPFSELYSHADDVTYMGAEGTYRVGWDEVYGDWTLQAEKSLGGHVEGSEIRVVVSGTMASATHYTKGTVRTAEGKVVAQQVRETSVFRMEEGAWKMIAHHADNYPVWEGVVDR